jgi:hypothetical protein
LLHSNLLHSPSFSISRIISEAALLIFSWNTSRTKKYPWGSVWLRYPTLALSLSTTGLVLVFYCCARLFVISPQAFWLGPATTMDSRSYVVTRTVTL